MAWLTDDGSQAALDAVRACDLLDARVAELYGFVATCATTLSEAEYAQVCEDYEHAVAPARDARTRFDALLDSNPPHKTTGRAETGYTAAAAELHRLLLSLDEPAQKLQRYAEARTETERSAGRLASDIAAAHKMTDVMPPARQPEWLSRLDQAQENLNVAAQHASERRWLAAMNLVELSVHEVAGLLREGADATAEYAASLEALTQAAEKLAEVRSLGMTTLTAYRSLPEAQHDQYEGYLQQAGQAVLDADRLLTASAGAARPEPEQVSEALTVLAAARRLLDQVADHVAAVAGQHPATPYEDVAAGDDGNQVQP